MRLWLIILAVMLLAVPVLATNPGEQWINSATSGSISTNTYGYAIFNNGTSGNITIAGGYQDVPAYVGEVWATKDGTDFSRLNASAFPGRAYMGYTMWDGKMWILGGANSTQYFNDSWFSVDGFVWTRVNASSGWGSRSQMQVFPYNGKLWVVGGYNGTSGTYYQDAWFLTTANESAGLWTKAATGIGTFYGGTTVVFNGLVWMFEFGNAYWSTDGITFITTSTICPGLPSTGLSSAVLGGKTIVLTGGGSNEVCYSTDGATWTIANVSANLPTTNYLPIINYTVASSDVNVPWRGYEGLYMFKLQTYSPLGWKTYVALAPPVASATPASSLGTAPYPVAWNDLSTGYEGASFACGSATCTPWVWDFRDGYFSYEQNASHIFTSAGSYAVLFTVASPFGSSVFTSNISVSTQQSQVEYYTQKQVRLRAVDAMGNPISGAYITANYVNSTLPSTNTTWLVSAFGITPSVASEMTNGGVAMNGLTTTDGSVTFVMFPSLSYRITVFNGTAGYNNAVTLSPQDSDYTIYCTLPSQVTQNQTYMQLSNTSLWITEPNSSFVTFHLTYYDPAGLTTYLKYNVTEWDNQSPMYYKVFNNIGKSVVSDANYTVPNVKGQEWRFWYNATRSV